MAERRTGPQEAEESLGIGLAGGGSGYPAGTKELWLFSAMTDIYLRTRFFTNIFIFIAFKEINVHKILRGACTL